MIHVGDARADRIEGFERTHQRARWKYFDLDGAGGRNADHLRQTHRVGVEPGVSAGQSVTIFSCRIPCAIAGAGKLKPAPAATDPAPARISRRRMAAFLRNQASPRALRKARSATSFQSLIEPRNCS